MGNEIIPKQLQEFLDIHRGQLFSICHYLQEMIDEDLQKIPVADEETKSVIGKYGIVVDVISQKDNRKYTRIYICLPGIFRDKEYRPIHTQ